MKALDLAHSLWNDGYHEAAEMLEKLAKEYLEICQNECVGDRSVGIPDCPFYKDLDECDLRRSADE